MIGHIIEFFESALKRRKGQGTGSFLFTAACRVLWPFTLMGAVLAGLVLGLEIANPGGKAAPGRMALFILWFIGFSGATIALIYIARRLGGRRDEID